MTPAPRDASIRIAIVDDHAVVREGLRLLIGVQPGFSVVGDAAGTSDALALIEREKPDVVLLDLVLGSERGEEMIGEIRQIAPDCAILILTGLKAADGHKSAILRGARGVVAKESAAEVLIKAIRKVHQGEIWLERAQMGSLLTDLVAGPRPQDPAVQRIQALTKRERDVIALVGQGLRNEDIGTRLALRGKTVRNHLTSIYEKLGVKDRLELAIYAHRHQLASLEQLPVGTSSGLAARNPPRP